MKKQARFICDNRHRIHIPSHPRANTKGYIYESILIVETVLGKDLPTKAVVHHIDRNSLNNSQNNLVVCENQAYHNRIHKRARSFQATGSPNNSYCFKCQTWKNVEEFKLQANGMTPKLYCKAKHAR